LVNCIGEPEAHEHRRGKGEDRTAGKLKRIGVIALMQKTGTGRSTGKETAGEQENKKQATPRGKGDKGE